jgi:hypothetical protein
MVHVVWLLESGCVPPVKWQFTMPQLLTGASDSAEVFDR